MVRTVLSQLNQNVEPLQLPACYEDDSREDLRVERGQAMKCTMSTDSEDVISYYSKATFGKEVSDTNGRENLLGFLLLCMALLSRRKHQRHTCINNPHGKQNCINKQTNKHSFILNSINYRQMFCSVRVFTFHLHGCSSQIDSVGNVKNNTKTGKR